MMRATVPFVAAALFMLTPGVQAQTLSGPALVQALQRGGSVLVIRHTSSPRQAPDQRSANADNVNRERQLDETGRATAAALGEALRRLHLPIGEVLTSPTYRARETVRLAHLPNPRPQQELGDRGQSMQGVTPAQTDWLTKKATGFSRGTNTVLVMHFPNMAAAFPQWTEHLADGETLVIGPDGKGGAILIARITIDQWPRLSE